MMRNGLVFRVVGKLAMAKPCKKCEAYMREHGVHAVEWSDEFEIMHKERL
jgi:hypothetical protein